MSHPIVPTHAIRHPRAPRSARGAGGFSLVELMIAVFIISVLTALAYSAYQDSVVRSRRAAASACLVEVQQFMERFRTTNLRYDVARNGTAVPAPACGAGADVTNFYTIDFSAAPTATAYTVRATPTGGQLAQDTKCGTLTLNQAAVRTKSGTGTLDDCW